MRNLIGKLPLQIVMTAPFVLIIVATIGLTGYLAFRNGQNAVNDLAGQLHREVAARIQQHLDAYLATPLLINQLNLDGIRLGQLDAHNLEAMDRHFLAQIQRFDSVISLAYASEQREYVGATRKTLGLDLVAVMASAKTGYALEAYKITPQGGREFVGSLPDYDPRSRPWYQAAVQAGRQTWTPIFLWSSGDVGLDAVVPVYAVDNRLLGVLDTSLTLNGLGDFLQSLQVSKNGQTFIVDRAGLLVASSTITEPFIRVGDDIKQLSALESGDPVAQTATHSLEQQVGTLANITAAQPFYFDLGGERQFAQATPYQDEYGLDWLIVVVIPESDFMAHINANTRHTALLIAVSLLGAMVIATLTARWVTQPVLRLNQSAKALAQGDWTQRVATNRRDEVGQLAASFNRMAEQLQTAFASLQASEARYQSLFEDPPISLWEEDFSVLKRHLDNLRDAGVTDWRAYFEHHPEAARRCAEMVKITDVNRATLQMFKAENKKELLGDLTRVFGEATYAMFRQELISLAEGRPVFEAETVHQTLPGDEIYVDVRLSLVPGYEDTWSKVLVSLTDITERKRVEEALRESEESERRFQEQLKALHAVSMELSMADPFDELCRLAVELGRSRLGFDRLGLWLLDDDSRFMVGSFGTDENGQLRDERGKRLLADPTSQFAEVLFGELPIEHRDDEPLYDDDHEVVGRGWSAMAAMWDGDKVIGCIITDNLLQQQPVSKYQLELLRLYGSTLGHLCTRKRVEEVLQQYAERLRVLHEIDLAILAARSPEEIAQAALGHIRQLIPCRRASVTLFDYEADEAVILAVNVSGDTRLGVGKRLPLAAFGSIAELRQGQPHIVADILALTESSHTNEQLLAEGVRSYTSVPLISQSELIGALNLGATNPGVFTAEHMDIAREVAAQLAVAILQARLFEAERARVQELEALQRASLSLTASLELSQVLDSIVRAAFDLVSAGHAHIFLYAEDRLTYGAALWADGRQETPFTEPRPGGLTYTVARQGEPIVVSDMRTHPLFAKTPTYGQGAIVGLPLKIGQHVVGVMNIARPTSGAFSEAELRALRLLADQAAIAIENARLFEAEAQRRREAEALQDIASVLNSTLNLEEVLDRILSNVGRVVQHNMVTIALIESGVTHVVRAQGYDSQRMGEKVLQSHHVVADTPTLRQMAETGQPVVIPDTLAHPDWIVKDEPWLRSYAGAPIRLEGEVIGFLNLDSDIPGFFTAAVAERLQVFADQAALAIKNARLYAETEQRAEHLAVLHELDRAITASLDIDDVYRAFTQHTRRLLPCDHMSIGLVEGDQIHAIFPADEERLAPVKTTLPLKTPAGANWVIEQGQPLLSGDLVSDQRFPPNQPAIDMGLRSAMILPLRVKGQIIGIWFLGRRQVEGYHPDDLAIAQAVAEQLAIAIENVRLFEQVQRYTAELEQRVADRTRELSALYEVTAVASESLDLKMMLELILERVLGAMRSQIGGIHLLNETRETLHLTVQQDLPPDLAVQLETLPVGRGLPGWVIQHGDPLIVPDVAMDPRSVEAGRIGFQAYVGVPMRASGQVLGVLSVARAREQPQFNVEEVSLLTTIADQVGVVVESARLRQQAEQSAVMAERARLARDLHDSVTQLLYSVNLFATVGREAYNLNNMAEVNSCLNELSLIAQQALKEMRLLVYELRPSALAQDGLVGALRQRLDAVERRAGVQARLQADTMLDLPRQIEEALYHIAQEALNNTLKHAAATTVTVRVEASDGRVELEVTDNGSGFDPTAGNGQGGLGLISMQERVEKLGGTLTILSTPGGGTKVRVSLEV